MSNLKVNMHNNSTMSSVSDLELNLNKSGVHIPKYIVEPRSLSSKKDRERKTLKYIPPAPRPHYIRSAPSHTRLIHSRKNDSYDLDNSFHLFMASAASGSTTNTFFRQYFEIQERLGYGSFGDVFRVKSLIDNKEYAVKKSRNTYAGEGDRTRQLNEVQRVVNIPDSVYLVEIDQAWEEDGHLYLQMELCHKSLNHDIEEGHAFDEEQSWNVLIDMLYALKHLHKYKLVHMDVKPDNIFLSLTIPITYKLGDFGIVVSLEDKTDITEYNEGDSRYLAPEVMQGIVTTKADVFSLGMTILEVASHVDIPKGGELWHQLRSGQNIPLPSHIEIPESLKEIIKIMLNPNINSRPEVDSILEIPEVKKRARKRTWMLRKVYVEGNVMKMNSNKSLQEVNVPSTPEMDHLAQQSVIPDITINDNSFSDADEDEIKKYHASSPIFASTPISYSNSKPGSSRLRSGRTSRLFGNHDISSSPTSRNLLKEFEAVSD